ncbi:DUF4168 domain-containing protein [Hyphomonas pacifica]|uniref:Uncharacterized protein n=1 Tax=Hyphomonas pacifica TaxID=1280941 RepID=A0A062U848_9PROT|nr:DUF4168 domain-containing protein [Hyphomonas pacifica]KCZ52784.1 hypothetical protein HY2_07575 [Hyphomonas pacifica]RAN33070.1 hypothetical protein HY3_13550 [Hyphomonas pacifica]RAN33729.1 hypothetical protein HY11_03290 [Hyphomonas pacifica]
MALKTTLTRTGAAVAAIALMTSGAAFAQAPQAPAAQTQAEPVTEAEITKFAAANKQVNTIITKMSSELESAPDASKASEIQTSYQQKIESAITQEGLTTNRYTEIVQMAQADPALTNKIIAEMEG